ncbi:MAG: hypothetical protein BGP04_08565 [Rhizobiales bacterium 62-17]|nr:MAG: hypothetical protein BGP04_08565 [Rhizobiales bacterium 62-17]
MGLISTMATKHFRNLLRATDGNVAVMVAFALLPMLIMIGAAVDYSRDLRVQTALQAAVDAAALNTARQSPGLTSEQMLAIAQKSVAASFGVTGVSDPTTTMVYTPVGNKNATIQVTARVSVPTTFMNLVGVKTNDVAATSTSTWGSTRLRVALALDNTGSMDDPPKKKGDPKKIEALRTATNNLLTSLKNAAGKDGDVYVSIVPFARVVNVGKDNVAASWITWNYWLPNDALRWCGSTCSRDNWDGSVMDRDKNSNLSNIAPTSSSTLFPATQASDSPVSLMGLSYDWAKLKTKVDSMKPNGATNQTIGIAWAWQSLTTGAPLNAPAKDEAYKYTDVIIILSDGLNTRDRWDGNGRDYSPEVDARQKPLCDAIKKTGVVIYSVQVNTNNDPTAEALKYCASDPAKFVMLTTADQIITTFESIGASLSQLRLSN